jgi:hypothetical protein
MKFYDFILGLLLLFILGGIGIFFMLKLGITLPVLEKDLSKFFGIKMIFSKFFIRRWLHGSL